MILDEILAHKRLEVAERKRVRPLPPLPSVVPVSRSFSSALRQPGVSFIAEIKRKSPSGGALRPGASAADLAAMYESAGAAALSVLTDAAYFGGTDDDLGHGGVGHLDAGRERLHAPARAGSFAPASSMKDVE